MSNLEIGCKWYFAPQMGGRDEGPNDPMQNNFKKTPYASLIRESIQNSLDVPLDESKPVRMKFSIGRIRAKEYPNFFQLKQHAQGCIDFYKENDDAKLNYQPMVNYFDSLGDYDNLSYIKVSDYNTRGMNYIKGDTTTPFYAFVRSAGVSSKKEKTAGGSFGFGKAAYFYISPLRTIFVSTQTEHGQKYFEGVSSLCTHKLEGQDGRFVSVGYYDNNNGEPVTNSAQIPSRFQRLEAGSDIYIMGIDATDCNGIYKEMIEAVLRNFWLAIHECKLEIKINDIEISSENLYELVQKHFVNELDNTSIVKKYNPLPYLDAVKNSGTDVRHVMIEDNLPTIGHVRFYALKNKNARDKILYMRRPLMLVKAQRTQSSNGFYGVFICDDKLGNKVLRKIENPAHNEWKSANWKENNKTNPKGKAAIADIDNFIIKAIEQMFSSRDRNVQNIQGLEEFLYIPTAVEDEDDFENETLVGEAVDQKDEEGNALSTNLSDISKAPRNDKSSVGKVMLSEPQAFLQKQDTNGDILSGHGTKQKSKKGGGGMTPRKIDSRYSQSENGSNGTFLSEVPVAYRSFAQVENGHVVHNIVINSSAEYENGRIDIIVGGDQADDVVTIKSCSLEGDIVGNTISGLHLLKGKNIFKIQFVDNMKHAVKLDAYEIK